MSKDIKETTAEEIVKQYEVVSDSSSIQDPDYTEGE